jgi:hypothetical protein
MELGRTVNADAVPWFHDVAAKIRIPDKNGTMPPRMRRQCGRGAALKG